MPSQATLIGEFGSAVIAHPHDPDSFYVIDYLPGRLLVAYGDREMFVVNPLHESQSRGHYEQKLHLDDAFDLYETFTGLKSGPYWNTRFPLVRKPVPCGRMAIIRYRARKMEDDGAETGWYEHYFDGGETGFPAPAPIFSLSNGQYWIPADNWKITKRGIEYYDARSETGSGLFNHREGEETWF